MLEISQIFALLFLMLGPFKIIGPFAKMTQGADPTLIRQLAIRATMLLTRHMGKLLFLIPSILGAILGVVQVSLGLMIMYNQLKILVSQN